MPNFVVTTLTILVWYMGNQILFSMHIIEDSDTPLEELASDKSTNSDSRQLININDDMNAY